MSKIFWFIGIGILILIGYGLYNFIKTYGFFELLAWFFIGISLFFLSGLTFAILTNKKEN